jgi:GNAT superfamily N-acetyltransferase
VPSFLETFDDIRRISADIDLSSFDCGNPDFNDFIRNEALPNFQGRFSVTYIGFIEGEFAAYVTLAAGTYRTEDFLRPKDGNYRYRTTPAVKIARIATSTSFQGKGCGTRLVKYSFAVAMKVAEYIGCKLIVTDALPERISWYRGIGFELSTNPKTTKLYHKSYPMFAIIPG